MVRMIINIAGLTGSTIMAGMLIVALFTRPDLMLAEKLFGAGWLLASLAVMGWAIAGIARAEP